MLYAMSLLYVVAGAAHFIFPDAYIKGIPPFLPWPEALNWISGGAEVLLAVALLPTRTRRLAGWGLIALLVAVFPANVYMAIEPEAFAAPPLVLWLRLPLQGVLIAWAWWYTRPDPADATTRIG
jgi:uncharacterized membrane protein